MKELLNESIAVIFDDHAMFTDPFSAALERYALFRRVYAFNKEAELISFFLNLPNRTRIYLFIDYQMPERNAPSVIQDVKRISRSVTVIVLSTLTNPVLIKDLLQHSGIQGFISKTSGFNEIVECLHAIGRNEQFISPDIKNMLNDVTEYTVSFTPRELEILQCCLQGYSIEITAKKLFISINTVITHRRRMMRKANCKSTGELIAYARKIGII
ncbi:MAG: response regulator transcription factor [Taibaiella sp.]|nr:response regulator transcription factor [Taibaiella sp.]